MRKCVMFAMLFCLVCTGELMAQDPPPLPPDPNPNPVPVLVSRSFLCEGVAASKTMAFYRALLDWQEQETIAICELEAEYGPTWEQIPGSFNLVSVEYLAIEEDGEALWLCWAKIRCDFRKQE